jgi:hypothetical protein
MKQISNIAANFIYKNIKLPETDNIQKDVVAIRLLLTLDLALTIMTYIEYETKKKGNKEKIELHKVKIIDLEPINIKTGEKLDNINEIINNYKISKSLIINEVKQAFEEDNIKVDVDIELDEKVKNIFKGGNNEVQ